MIGLIACSSSTEPIALPTQTVPIIEAPQDVRPQQPPTVSTEEELSPIAPADFFLFVDDTATLIELEKGDYNFLNVIDDPTKKGKDNKTLYAQSNRYRHFVNNLSSRIESNRTETLKPLVTELHQALKYPAGNVGRAFDVNGSHQKKRSLNSLD